MHIVNAFFLMELEEICKSILWGRNASSKTQDPDFLAGIITI
jgi:hypothetical protein